MMTLLLVIIYISFISLGLPDSLLGSAWTVIRADLGVPVSFAGVISMIVSCGTIVSSLMSVRLIRKLGTGLVTAISVGLTALALLGFGISGSGWFLCLCAIPLGLGAGSVDAALNNFVALHYKATHMNWLHCFWGLGATSGPIIMSLWLARENNWHMGYMTIGIIQCVLVAVLIISLPLWKKVAKSGNDVDNEDEVVALPLMKSFSVKYAKPAMLAFFCYCAVELTTGLWCGTYAVQKYGVSPETAAMWTSTYYLGITLGRLICGFIAMRLRTASLIRLGCGLVLAGIVVLFLPLSVYKIPVGLCFIGIGCAPIFPNMIHRTPQVFGQRLSQSMMGIQMASAYVGNLLMPPLFGMIAQNVDIGLLPIYLLILTLLMVVCTEAVTRRKQGDRA